MKIKLISAIAVVACSLVAVSVNAEQFNVEAVTIGTDVGNLTNTVAATTTNSSMAVAISTQKYKKLGLAVQTKLAGAGTTAVDYIYTKTADGSNYTTANTGSFTVTPTGTVTVNTIVSIDATGLKGIKITTINNPNAAALTNLAVNAVYKQADN
jgi:hypothetical protein